MIARTRLLNVLLLSALALAASRLWLFLGEPPPTLPEVAAPAAAPGAGTVAGESPAPAAEIRPESYDLIVARDLFSPNRGLVPPAPAAAVSPPQKPQPPPKLTLYGVVILDGEKSAYLQEGTQEARPRKVREDEHFAGGTVRAIRPDGVTFLFGGTEIVVPLRAPKDGSAPPRPSEPPVPGQAPKAPTMFPRHQPQPGLSQGQTPAVPGFSRFQPPTVPVEADPEEEIEFQEEPPIEEDEQGLPEEESEQ